MADDPALLQGRRPSERSPVDGRVDSSATMRPSSISIRRGMRSAMARSWVMTTMVTPWACRSSKRREDGLAGGLVEVAGGLVGQHDGRAAHQGPGDGHPLALAARELGGAGVGRSAEPDALQRVGGLLAPLGEATPA